MALFQTQSGSAAQAPSYLAEIKCGRMKFDKDSKMVTPEEQKGLIYVEKSKDDGMIHLCWKQRGKSTNKLEDWLVFEGDVKVKLITQLPEHRVFFLKFNATNERFFFWMQNADKVKDIGDIERLDMALNHTSELEKLNKEKDKAAGKSDNAFDMSIPGIPKELQSMLANDPNSANMIQQILANNPSAMEAMGLGGAVSKSSKSGKGGKAPSTKTMGKKKPAGSSGGKPGQTSIGDLEKALAMVQQASNEARDQYNLVKALDKDSLAEPLKSEQAQERLRKHMPDSDKIDKSSSGLASTLQTPQYQQAVGAFQEALESRQLGQVLSQFGLPEKAVKACDNGDPKQFAEALQGELCKKKEGDESKNEESKAKEGDDKGKEDNNEKSEESSKSKDDEADKMAVD